MCKYKQWKFNYCKINVYKKLQGVLICTNYYSLYVKIVNVE